MSSSGNSEKNPCGSDPAIKEFLSERARDEAIIQLKTMSGRTAADIGAGTGFMSEGLLDAELKVIALESSPSLVEFMKEKFADIKEFEAVLTTPGTLKLGDDSVDYAFANMYLHHAENPLEAVKEIIRILKPGGKAAITDLLFHGNEELTKNYNDRWPGFSLPDLYEWFISAGFRDISIENLKQCCTYTDESGKNINIDILIACGEK